MSKGRYEYKGCRHRRSVGRKSLVLVLACVLLVGGVVGGTVAWLTAETKKVTNVFTTSDITVELKEHTYDASGDKLTDTETDTGVNNYKMVPGWTIPKDPWVTVSSTSEDCYLFVKIQGDEKASISKNDNGTYNLGGYIVYAVESNWTALDDTKYPNIFYKVIEKSTDKGVAHDILGAGTYTDASNVEYTWDEKEVLTKPEVTKEMMTAVKDNNPTLSFTAYAVQLWKSNESGGDNAKFTAEEAWLKISPTPP